MDPVCSNTHWPGKRHQSDAMVVSLLPGLLNTSFDWILSETSSRGESSHLGVAGKFLALVEMLLFFC